MISLILFRCAKRFILPQKTKTSEKRVRSFQSQNSTAQSHKMQYYHNSFFFIIVFLQFSIEFYFSGCLFLITNSKLVIYVGKKGILQKIMRVNQRKIHHEVRVGKCNFYIIPLLEIFILMKTIAFWAIPILTNCGFRISEKRNNTISQMRLRSVFKMRMSILNTATTEQMGYGIISFFVYTKFTN